MSVREPWWMLLAGSFCALACSNANNSSETTGPSTTSGGTGGMVPSQPGSGGVIVTPASGGAPAGSGGTSSTGNGGAPISSAGGAAGTAFGGSTGSGGSASGGQGGTGHGGTGGTSGAAGASPDAGSLPPTGKFPAVQDPTAMGPYMPQTVGNTGPNSGYTVYRPAELAPNGVLNPIVSWGNGAATTPSLYPLLPHLASQGFVVIASNSSSVTADLVKGGVDWIVQQNETMGSPYYHKLDTQNVAGVGYSLGGLATYGLAGDPRVVTTVIVSGANMMGSDRSSVGKLKTPIAYFCTDDAASRGNCDGDFAVVTVPAFYGVMKGSQHVDVVFNASVQTLVSKAITGWLRWYQMEDQTQKALFTGSSCGLCTDSKWTVQQKNGL